MNMIRLIMLATAGFAGAVSAIFTGLTLLIDNTGADAVATGIGGALFTIGVIGSVLLFAAVTSEVYYLRRRSHQHSCELHR